MKNRLNLSRALLPSVFVMLAQSMPAAYAQENVEFFDDFSSNSFGYQIDNQPDDRAVKSFVVTPNGIEIRVRATGDDQGQARVRISDRTDEVRSRFSISSNSELAAGDDSEVRMRIAGTWYNDIQDGGLGNDNREGDVYAQARLRHRPGRSEFSICLDRTNADGSNADVQIFDNGSDQCTSIPGFELELDRVYEAHLSIDREARTITFGIDEQAITTPVGQTMYLPSSIDKKIELTHRGATGEAVGMVSAIGTDGDLQDFNVNPLVMGPYRPVYDLQDGIVDLRVSEGRLRFDATAPADDRQNLGLYLSGASNRIEGVIELSSDSIVGDSEDSFAQVRLAGRFYNDVAEGGFNGDEGDVFAAITLRAAQGDARSLDYCLFRANNADFSDALELECGDFGIAAELNKPYSASINTDLDAKTVTFTVDGVVREYNILGSALAPNAETQFIQGHARANSGSTVVAYLDDFGTSRDATPVANLDNSVDTTGSTTGGTDGGTVASSSGGGGGCSISSGGANDWSLMAMALMALVAGLRRRMLSK